MGMFDNIKCSYPLPGDPPEFVREPGHVFQTKSLDDTLSLYEITTDGQLVDSKGSPVEPGFTGVINFYDGNSVGGSHGFSFTPNGEDAEWVEYEAKFASGKLVDIAEITRSREPALPKAVMDDPEDDAADATDDDANQEDRSQEQLVGRTMFVDCLGLDDDYFRSDVTVVYDGPKEWCVLHPPGNPERPRHNDNRLEIIDRRMRDFKLFDSREAAQRARDGRQSKRDRTKTRYERLLAEQVARRTKGLTP